MIPPGLTPGWGRLCVVIRLVRLLEIGLGVVELVCWLRDVDRNKLTC